MWMMGVGGGLNKYHVGEWKEQKVNQMNKKSQEMVRNHDERLSYERFSVDEWRMLSVSGSRKHKSRKNGKNTMVSDENISSFVRLKQKSSLIESTSN